MIPLTPVLRRSLEVLARFNEDDARAVVAFVRQHRRAMVALHVRHRSERKAAGRRGLEDAASPYTEAEAVALFERVRAEVMDPLTAAQDAEKERLRQDFERELSARVATMRLDRV